MRANLGANEILERRDDLAARRVVLGICREEHHDVEREPDREPFDLNVSFLEDVEESDLNLAGEIRQRASAIELPYGRKRALELATTLALDPELLLLDEPTAGMGDEETYRVTGLIRRLHRDSKYTIVLIEHDMRVVFHLADRISVLAEGQLLAEGTPEEISANEHVQNAYLGKAE